MKYKYICLILFIFSLLFNLDIALSKNNQHTKPSTINYQLSTNTNFAPEDSFSITQRQFRNLFYQATDLYAAKHFEQALPIFLSLLRPDPDNSHIAFYVGACLMNLSGDKAAPLPFLQKAVKNTTISYDYDYRSTAAPVLAYYYLAIVYKRNYKMKDAIANYKIFKSFVSQDNKELISKVNEEIKSLEIHAYDEHPEYSKYFNKLVDELIQYDVFIKSPEQADEQTWWVNNLEGIKREIFVDTLMNVAYSDTVPVYDENNKRMTNDQVKAVGTASVLKRFSNPKPPYNDTTVLVETQLDRQSITKVRFLEEWYIDDITMEIGKKVVGYSPLVEEYTEDFVVKGFKPLFTLYFDDRYPALFFKNNNDSLAEINPSLVIRDTLPSDTLEKKVIDFTQSTDYTTNIKGQSMLTERIRYDVPIKGLAGAKPWVGNIDSNNREAFLTQLFDMVANGVTQSYDIFGDSLSVKQAKVILQRKTDTIFTKAKTPPYRDTVIINTTDNFDYKRVSKLRFMEEWYLNKKNARLTKRVLGLAPLIEILAEDKTIKGYTTLFWIYFDKKYPIELKQKASNSNIQH